MSQRSRILVGSFVGAVAIHAAMVACSSSRTSTLTPDATAPRDAVATLLDVARDVVGTVLDAELRDARADDAGCGCTPQASESSFSLDSVRIDAATLRPLADYSTSSGFAQGAPTTGGGQAVRFTNNVTFIADDGSFYVLSCSVYVRPDGTPVDRLDVVPPTARPTCNLNTERAGGGSEFRTGAPESITTLRLTNTEIEVRIGRVEMRPTLGPTLPAAVLTNLTFRLSNPSGRFLAIPRALRP